jgi:hypothetical protein
MGKRSPASSGDVAALWALEPDEAPTSSVFELTDLIYSKMADGSVDDRVIDLLERAHPLTLDNGAWEIPARTLFVAQSAAGAGYIARLFERERVPSAADKDSWRIAAPRLREAMRRTGGSASNRDDTMALAAAWLARKEHSEEPDPAPAVPGLSAWDRRRLRERSLLLVARPGANGVIETPDGPVDDVTFDDLRRAWSYGFVLRCLEELLFEEAAGEEPLE